MDRRRFGVIVRRLAAKASGTLLTVSLSTLSLPAVAQSTVWDSVWTNSNWYVPVPNLVAYTASSQDLSQVVLDRRSDALDDRHLRSRALYRRQQCHAEHRLVRKLLDRRT